MNFRLKPKEEKFFLLLDEHAELSYKAAEIMEKAFLGEMDKEKALAIVTDLEHEADEIVVKTADLLMKTFITPMDREDIQTLVEQLDDTIDGIKDIMDKMCMYRVGEPSEGAIALCSIATRCTHNVAKSMSYMGNLKKNHLKVEARAKKVVKLEEKADVAYHEEMAKIFGEWDNPIEIIKWKDILDGMEEVIDGCEDLVSTFRRVVLKYA